MDIKSAEGAIQCFESITNLNVVVHDLRLQLWQHLPWKRSHHHHHLCCKVKEKHFRSHCIPFDTDQLRAEALQWKDGRVQRCHAGIAELSLPVFDEEGLLFVLFAGPFRMVDVDRLDVSAKPSSAWLEDLKELPALSNHLIEPYQEMLRQLGSRLRCIAMDFPIESKIQRSHHVNTTVRRRHFIEHHLQSHMGEPLQLSDLAKVMGLSVDRCRHVVRECCGIGFSEFLQQLRLQAATSLLLNTHCSIEQVALRCGLSDPSSFSKRFKRSFGLSPGAWRSKHRG